MLFHTYNLWSQRGFWHLFEMGINPVDIWKSGEDPQYTSEKICSSIETNTIGNLSGCDKLLDLQCCAQIHKASII